MLESIQNAMLKKNKKERKRVKGRSTPSSSSVMRLTDFRARRFSKFAQPYRINWFDLTLIEFYLRYESTRMLYSSLASLIPQFESCMRTTAEGICCVITVYEHHTLYIHDHGFSRRSKAFCSNDQSIISTLQARYGHRAFES